MCKVRDGPLPKFSHKILRERFDVVFCTYLCRFVSLQRYFKSRCAGLSIKAPVKHCSNIRILQQSKHRYMGLLRYIKMHTRMLEMPLQPVVKPDVPCCYFCSHSS